MRSHKQVKRDPCMKFYDVVRPLYLETDTSSISPGARLLQVKDGMIYRSDKIPDNAILKLTAFASKSISSAEWF